MHWLLADMSIDPLTKWLLVIAAALTIFWAVFRGSLKRKKDPLAPAGPRFPLSQQRAVEREVNNLLVEMLEMARQMTAQLDTRSTKLQLLIEQADRRLAQLKGLLPADSPAMADAPAREAKPEPSSAPLAAQDWPPEDKPEPAAPPPVAAPAAPSAAERHREIYELADAGRSPRAIAQELARPVGEIELILALRR